MNRIPDIQRALRARDLDGILITGAINRRWATGFQASAGALVVTETETVFITDGRYTEGAASQVQGAEILRIEGGETYPDIIAEVLVRNQVKRLGFEENVMTQGAYTRYQAKLPVELVPSENLLDELRSSKTPAEYALMRAAQEITDRTFAEILPLIAPALTEWELAAEIGYRLLKNGAEGTAFDPIVLAAPRSSMPHGTPGDHKLTGFVILDFGAVYQGYCADMTRTLCVGAPTEEMRQVYEIVQKAQMAGIRAMRAGVEGREVDRAAREVIAAAGYGDCFSHSFGHSLGMEVHESLRAAPTEERILPLGAVLSAEPGIYLPGKFGVRIEDTLYLTETGHEILTKTPKDLIIL